MDDSATTPAFIVNLVDNDSYSQATAYKLLARVGHIVMDSHRAYTFSEFSDHKGAQLANFQVSAYVNADPNDSDTVWGSSYEFHSVYSVGSVAHARLMASVLSKVDKGMERLRDKLGYVPGHDYGAYLFRVAGILGIPDVYLRNGSRRSEMTGQRYRKVNASDMQSWVHHMVAEIMAGRAQDHVK